MKNHLAKLLSRRRSKAFTLVEILVFVVLVAILIAAIVPIYSQHKAALAQTTMQNDGLRIGTAAQIYFAETLERSLTLKYDPATGTVSGPEAFRIQDNNKIQPEYEFPNNEIKITYATKEAFALKHPRGGRYVFDDKGNLTHSE